MKREHIVTAITCVVILGLFIGLFKVLNLNGGREGIKVGFIYDNDESTPYTYNFSLAKDALEKKYGEKIEIMFNPTYVMDPLKAIDDDEVTIGLNNGHSPAVIRCSIPFLYVLMPLRIN